MSHGSISMINIAMIRSTKTTLKSDINASINIGNELETLTKRKLLDSNKGFYWNLVEQEHYIVPVCQKTSNNILHSLQYMYIQNATIL